ncbi:hypothetical protein Y032_0137g2002 [Ancylostoma ceylanicum]|uniref:TOG domain-containing protein n=2 Tax=Ancylostoma ceylanicum TaxID=53326 RepID=A0A016T4Y9_9BILA|nr:hypothetical protein Y032_0137g2002 [Ancylostoma ceylanicum]
MSWLSPLLERNSSDPRVRMELGQELLDRLAAAGRLPSDSKTINEFCDILFQWMASSNFKVSLLSLEILQTSIDVSGDVLAPYLLERVTNLVERLGDTKPQVREAASCLLIDLANVPHSSHEAVLERMSPGFQHKQYLVRIGTMDVFVRLLDESRDELEVQTNRLIPTLCKLTADPNAEVREVAVNTLAHVMLVLGEEVSNGIRSRRLIPDNKMQLLMQRYETALRRSSCPSSAPRPTRPARRYEPHVRNGCSFLFAVALDGLFIRMNSDILDSRTWVNDSFEKALSMFRVPHAPGENGEADQENQVRSVPVLSRGSSMPAQKRIPTTLRNSGNSAGAVNEEDFRKAFTQVPKCDIYSAKELQSQLESIRQVLENSQLDWSQRVNSLKLLRSILINGGMDFESELITGVHCLEDALITSVKDLRSQVCREACITVSFLCEKLEASIVRLCEAILPATIGLIQNSAKIMSSSGANACYFIIKHVEHPKLIPIVLSYSSSKSKEIRKIVQDLVNQMLAIWTPTKLEKNLSGIIDCIKAGISDADPQARTSARNGYQQLDQHFPHQAQLLFQSLDPAKQRSLSGAMSAASSSQSINSERDSLHMAHRPGGLGLNRPKTTNFFAGRSASEIDANAVRRAAAYTPAKSKLTGSVATRNTPARPSVVRSGIPPSRQTPLKTNNSVNPPGSVSQPGSRSTSPSRTGANRRPAPVSSTPSVMSSSRIGIGRPRQIGTREASPRRFSGGTLNRGASANGHAAGNDTRQLCNAIRNFSLTADDEEFSLGVLRYDQAGLTDALNACTSSNLNERKDGLRSLLEILKSRRNIPPPDIKKICDVLNKLLTEGNHKLLSMVMDILNVFVSSYHDSLGDWLQFLLLRLLHKSGVEILPTVVQPLNMALKAVRSTFRPELQLIAICKNIQDPIQTPPVKAKAATLNYLHELLQGMEQGSNLSRDEVRGAVQKIFQWMEDPKNASIKMACERVIYDFFSLNTADFSTILSTYPPQWREFAYSLLKKNKPSESAVPRSPAAAPVHEAISDMSAQITDYVDSRGVMGPLATSANLSASPANVSHLLNGSSARAASNANDTDLSLGSIGEIESTLYLKDDVHQQNKFIAELLNELSNLDPLRRSEQNHALQTLQQMVSEGSLTTWEENFKSLILHIFNVLAVNDVTLKRSALKLLTKICVAQAVSFYDLAEMTLFKVLDSIAEEENPQVMNVADECLKTLATHFPLHVVIRATKPIIAQENDPRVGPALKMLTRLIESLDAEELTARLPEIAPGVVNCYSNPQSSVRKSTVFCLVAMVNKLGREPVNPYLTSLSNSKVVEKKSQGVLQNFINPSTRGVHSANTDVFYTLLITVTSP